jgi:hypothetical protein
VADDRDAYRHIEIERRLTALETRLDAMDKANHLAYSELQRRLDVLNHSHEEMVRDKEHYLPREVHEQFYDEYRAWRDSVNVMWARYVLVDNFSQFFQDFGKWRDIVNDTLSKQSARSATWIAAVGIAFALLQLSLKLIWK